MQNYSKTCSGNELVTQLTANFAFLCVFSHFIQNQHIVNWLISFMLPSFALPFLNCWGFLQIPVLKKALIDSNIWETKMILDSNHAENYEQYDDIAKEEYQIKKQKKTQFVKNFFDKRDISS